MINPLSYILSQGSKVPMLTSHRHVYPGALGFDSRTLLRNLVTVG